MKTIPKRIDDEEFYEEATEIIQVKTVTGDLMDFFTKTPTFLTMTEVMINLARQAYYDAIVYGAEKGKLKAVYCFARGPTARKLALMYSDDENISYPYLEHISRAYRLLKHKQIDLRAVPHTKFTSGIVTKNIAMAHFKPPGSLKTEYVDYITGPGSRSYHHEFNELKSNLPPLTVDDLLKFLNFDVRLAYLETTALAKEIIRTDAMKSAIWEVLTQPVLPGKSQFKQIANKHRDKNSNVDEDGFLENMTTIIEKHHLLTKSAEDLIKTSSLTFGSVPTSTKAAKRTLRVDFNRTKVFIRPSTKRIYPKNTNNLWKLLEYLLLREGEKVHCTWGFYISSRWKLPGKPKNGPYRQFGIMVCQLRSLLNEEGLFYNLPVPLPSAGYCKLVTTDFCSNITKMKKRMPRVIKLFKGERFDKAAKWLLKMVSEDFGYPGYINAHLLLHVCTHRAKDFTLTRKQKRESVKILTEERDNLKEAVEAAVNNVADPDKIITEQIDDMREKQQEIEACLNLIPDSANLLKTNISDELRRIYTLMTKYKDDSLAKSERDGNFMAILAIPFFKELRQKIVGKLRHKFFRQKPLMLNPDEFNRMLSEQITKLLGKRQRPRSMPQLKSLLFKGIYYVWQKEILEDKGFTATQQRSIRGIIKVEEELYKFYEKEPDEKQVRLASGLDKETYKEIDNVRRSLGGHERLRYLGSCPDKDEIYPSEDGMSPDEDEI